MNANLRWFAITSIINAVTIIPATCNTTLMRAVAKQVADEIAPAGNSLLFTTCLVKKHCVASCRKSFTLIYFSQRSEVNCKKRLLRAQFYLQLVSALVSALFSVALQL